MAVFFPYHPLPVDLEEEALICSVCLEPLDSAPAVTHTGDGGIWHPLHRVCVEQWRARGGDNCPVCRSPINFSWTDRVMRPYRLSDRTAILSTIAAGLAILDSEIGLLESVEILGSVAIISAVAIAAGVMTSRSSVSTGSQMIGISLRPITISGLSAGTMIAATQPVETIKIIGIIGLSALVMLAPTSLLALTGVRFNEFDPEIQMVRAQTNLTGTTRTVSFLRGMACGAERALIAERIGLVIGLIIKIFRIASIVLFSRERFF